MRLTRLIALLLLSAAVCAAQAPVVPTDHYGPPVCSAEPLPANRMSAAKAEAIEAAGAADPTALPSTTPVENFDIARYRLADYGACVGNGGCYWADLDAQYKRAEGALDRELALHHHGEKLAIVFDIDETSLSSYCEMQREAFGYIKLMSNEWVASPEAAVAIPGALRLFNRAKTAGVDVFFITGRPESQKQATARNLEAAGFHGWKGLALRDAAESSIPTVAYKSGRRKQLVAQGYRIILSVGDQWSDLNGEPKAEVSVKLPNPFYFLP
jgi:acid phosphatase